MLFDRFTKSWDELPTAHRKIRTTREGVHCVAEKNTPITYFHPSVAEEEKGFLSLIMMIPLPIRKRFMAMLLFRNFGKLVVSYIVREIFLFTTIAQQKKIWSSTPQLFLRNSFNCSSWQNIASISTLSLIKCLDKWKYVLSIWNNQDFKVYSYRNMFSHYFAHTKQYHENPLSCSVKILSQSD